MPPLLALFVTIVFCWVALWRYGRDPYSGGALWLPTIWIFFIGSRHPGQWLEFFGLGTYLGQTFEEGSPLDAAFFLVLILSGVAVLMRRGVQLAPLVRDNFWLFAFSFYSFLAIAWSDFPFVAFKRWIKTLGHPVMALVILSHPTPVAAFQTVLKQSGMLMLTLSVLFVKYFPEYGRTYNQWSGMAEYCGINNNKNELGYCCLVFGLFFAWNTIVSSKLSLIRKRNEERMLSIFFLLMALWLLKLANSATSLVTLIAGTGVILILGNRSVSKRFGTFMIGTIATFAILELVFGIYKPLLEILGRNATLTDRTQVWADVVQMVDVPLIGAGFESFWLGPRLETLWAKWWWHPNQAHNGYIETYLHLGWIGVFLLFAILLSTFRKITAAFSTELAFARFRMACLIVIMLYNFTEATFKALHLLWTMFYLIALRLPTSEQATNASLKSSEVQAPEEIPGAKPVVVE